MASTQSSATRSHDVKAARRNNAKLASFYDYDLDNPFAEGSFRFAAKGKYTVGERSGEPCVCKWFKTGIVFEETFYEVDINAVSKAHDMIREWNTREYISKPIWINIPQVWTCEPGCHEMSGSKALIEPFIHNYTKYNSNSGWADDATPWPRVMQALSHFSYHVSGGQFVLCDLQGGEYSNAVVLTDPVILSRNRSFGVTDLSSKGISSFFSNHKCNEFCKSEWKRPRDQTRYFVPRRGSSMMAATGAQQQVNRY
jgi:Alpha-kinase family